MLQNINEIFRGKLREKYVLNGYYVENVQQTDNMEHVLWWMPEVRHVWQKCS